MFILILVFSYLFGLSFVFKAFLFVYIFMFLLLRKKMSNYKEDLSIKKGVIYSPISGKILSVKKNVDHISCGENLLEVRISMPWWSECGIYLPFASEVKDLNVEPGRGVFRLGEELPDQKDKMFTGLCLTLESPSKETLGVQFVKCVTGLWPEVPLMPGDRGQGQVGIGFFPLGGTALLYLPANYEILVNNNDHVVGGETLIAGTPEDAQ